MAHMMSVLILILLSGPVLAGQAMTLEDCIAAGLKNNPSLEAARDGITAAGYGIKSARADFLPSLSSGYSISTIISERSEGPTEADYLDQNIHTVNIKLTQILFAGFRTLNSYRKAEAREQVAIAEKNLEQLNLIYKIETSFYRVMKALQDVKMMDESINRLQENIKAAELFFEKELVPYADLLQAKVDLSDAKERLGIAENNVNRERAVLFSLMGRPMEPEIEFSGDFYNAVSPELFDYDTLMALALKQRPDIKSLEFQREMLRKDSAVAAGGYLPVIQLDLGYTDQNRDYDKLEQSLVGSYDRDQKNAYWSAGIFASWKMFDGGRSWYEKKRFDTEARKIDSLILEAEGLISTGIRKAMFSLSEAEQRFQSTGETLKLSEEYYANEEHRLKAGISTVPALLKAGERLTQVKGNRTNAILDYHLAKAELKAITGD
jgi:outer membrane protein TolC